MQKAVQHLKKNLKPTFPKHFRLGFFTLSGLFFFLFAAFTVIVKTKRLRSFDFNMTVRLQDHVPHGFDGFFSLLSVVGRFEFIIVILIIILALKRKILGFVALALFGLAHLIEIVGKTFLNQPGPPHMFLRTTSLSTKFPGLYIDTNDTYPSGHAMRIMFLAVIIVFLVFGSKKFPKPVKWVLYFVVFLFTFLMVMSRVSLGEHWSTDVIGGSLLGLSFGFVSLFFL